MTVYLSDGAGRFRNATTYYVGPDPTGLTMADVNGDGKPDLLVGERRRRRARAPGQRQWHIPERSYSHSEHACWFLSRPRAARVHSTRHRGPNTFPVNSDTAPEFPVQSVALTMLACGEKMVLTEELDQADHAAQLYALNETSLALVGSLLVTTLNTTAGATLAAGTENQAEVNTSSLLVAPSQGQNVPTTSTSPESKAVPTGPEAPVARAQGHRCGLDRSSGWMSSSSSFSRTTRHSARARRSPSRSAHQRAGRASPSLARA